MTGAAEVTARITDDVRGGDGDRARPKLGYGLVACANG